MRTQQISRAFVMSVVVLGLACGPLDTGIAKAPSKNKPTPAGACPAAQTACGVGAFAWCADLQTDPGHCGACDRSCSPGIACQAGVCQQTACASSTSPFVGTRNSGQRDDEHRHRQTFADVNGDARLDLIEWDFDPNQGQDAFRVSLGQPGGGFAAPESYQAAFLIMDIRAANDNDDGVDDLFVLGATTLELEGQARAEVWLGHRDGHLTRARDDDLTGAIVGVRPLTALGDVSGDGWTDVVTMSEADHSITVFLSDSTGALHRTRTYRTGRVSAIFIRDWNGDGLPDLVVRNDRGVEILYNRGGGTFDESLVCSALLPFLGGDILAEDFNHDGLVDLAFYGNPIRVILRQSECGFYPVSVYDVPVPTSVPKAMGEALAQGDVPILRAGDMNGDGQLDLVVAFHLFYLSPLIIGESVENIILSADADTFLAVLLGNPDGTFQLQGTVVSLGSGTITDLAIGEGTGDQRPDVVVSSADGQSRVWENTCQ